MGNFMEYLNINPSTINQFFNTITREGQDQIFFQDVVQVIGYLEESKMKEKSPEDQGLNLNILEIKTILSNFEDLLQAKSKEDLQELLDGVYLMFVVDFEAKHGKGTAPDLFQEIDHKIFIEMLKNHSEQLRASLLNKLEEKNLKEEKDKIKVTLETQIPNKSTIKILKN